MSAEHDVEVAKTADENELMSRDVQYHLAHYEKKAEFKDALEEVILYYAFVLVPSQERELCEKGLIKHFSSRFGKDLINELSANAFCTKFTKLSYTLNGSVPRVFGEFDRQLYVSPED